LKFLDGKAFTVCSKPLHIQRWRMYETLSALQYIAKTCDASIKTAWSVRDVFRELIESNPAGKKKDWLEIGHGFVSLLQTCLYMKVRKPDGMDAFQCTINSDLFEIVDD